MGHRHREGGGVYIEMQNRGGHLQVRERSHKRSFLMTLWLQTASLQKSAGIHFYCLSPTVCGTLLPRPWQTSTHDSSDG